MTIAREALLIAGYRLRLVWRTPSWAVLALVHPLLYLLLFGPLLAPLRAVPGFPAGDTWLVLVPGLLVQLAVSGTLFVGFALLVEMRAGVIDRMLVTPTSRVGLLLGRLICDVTALVGQTLILLAVCLAFGMRVSLAGLLIMVALVALMGTGASAASYAAALKLRTEDRLSQVLTIAVVPVLLLSGILLPMSLAPPWLRALSRAMPPSYAVDGARAAARGELLTGTVVAAFGVTTLSAAVGIVLATRAFSRESQ